MSAATKLESHSPEAEVAVIGAALLEPETARRARDVVTPEDFYTPAARTAWTAICALSDASQEPTITAVTDWLRRDGTLDTVGGPTGLIGLTDQAVSAARIVEHATMVREHALERHVRRWARQLATAPADQRIIDRLEEARAELAAISGERPDCRDTSTSPAINEALALITKAEEGRMLGVPSGIERVDTELLGWQAPDLYVLAGRPGMGKTAFAMGVADHAAVDQGIGTLVFSMEMSRAQIMLRLLSSRAGVEAWRYRRGKLAPSDWDLTLEAASAFKRAPLYIDDRSALTPGELARTARAHVERKGVGLIIVDYLQLMQVPGEKSREREVSKISGALKAIAKDLGVPVIALAQLNRGVESREDKRPRLADLRDSGSLEQDADVVLFAYRHCQYHDHAEKRAAELIIAKYRNGETSTIDLDYDGRFYRFADPQPVLGIGVDPGWTDAP